MLTTSSASTQCSLSDICIAGITCAVPQHIQSLEDLLTDVSDSERKNLLRALQMSGLSQLHRAKPSTVTGDLCIVAINALLKQVNWSADSIDILIFASITPDELVPPTGYRLHNELNLSKGCIVIDNIMGCSAYTHGIWLAASLLSANNQNNNSKSRESEGCHGSRALLVTGDTLSKIINPTDIKNNALLGDGVCATAIEFCKNAGSMYFVLGSDGSGATALQQPGRGYRKSEKDPFFQMDGIRVFSFSHTVVPNIIKILIDYAKIPINEVDRIYLHQANKLILDNIVKRCSLPIENVPSVLDIYGNCGSAGLPLAICASRDGLPPRPISTILCGFGLGLSWSAIHLMLDPSVIGPVLIAENL